MDAYVWCQTTGIGCGVAKDTSPSSTWPHKRSQMGFQWCMRTGPALGPDRLCSAFALVPPQTRLLTGAVSPCHITQLAGTRVIAWIEKVMWSELLSSIHTDVQLPVEPESPPEPLTWSEKRSKQAMEGKKIKMYMLIWQVKQIPKELYWNFYHNLESPFSVCTEYMKDRLTNIQYCQSLVSRS